VSYGVGFSGVFYFVIFLYRTCTSFLQYQRRTDRYHNRLLDKMAVLSDPDDEIIDIMIPVMVFAGTLAFLTYLKMRWIYQAL